MITALDDTSLGGNDSISAAKWDQYLTGQVDTPFIGWCLGSETFFGEMLYDRCQRQSI